MSNNSVINNKRIIKNTIFLYFRLFFSMIVSLFTVRIVLEQLGIVDYGIYNVVGGVVMLFSFVSGTLAASSNRFMAKELVSGTKESIRKCFNQNLQVFVAIFLFIALLLESVGLWYLNHKMTIPQDRLWAANIVFQLSIIALFVNMLSVPYNSLVIIHEKMSFYSYLGIGEALLKLVVAILLMNYGADKLVFYAFLILLSSIITTFVGWLYCHRNFAESRLRWYWDKSYFKELMGFIGWYFFGTVSASFKSEGVNLLINLFFSPVVNAARGIACQVDGVTMRFADGYFTAAKPQIYKAYSNQEYDGLNLLISRTTIICVALISFLAFPVCFNADFILRVWLGKVPDYSVIFLQLIVLENIINASSQPVILTIMASGKLRFYQLLEFLFRMLVLVFGYVAFKMGAAAESIFWLCVCCAVCSVFMRLYCLHRVNRYFVVSDYCRVLLRITVVTIIVWAVTSLWKYLCFPPVVNLIATSVFSLTLLSLLYMKFILEAQDRKIILNKIYSYVHRK